MIAYVAYLSVSDIESECHIQKQKDRDREREKVARQRGAKIRPASCWEAVESPLHRRKSETSGYFCTIAEGNHFRAVIDWQCGTPVDRK